MLRQGDPLSTILFNAVMDLVLQSLDTKIGVDLGYGKHLAFADDVSLLSQTRGGMVRLCAQLKTALRSVGLSLNTNKSTIAIVVDGK
jgi:Reverse transcriptase (RNA-dependent DNA polymerase)